MRTFKLFVLVACLLVLYDIYYSSNFAQETSNGTTIPTIVKPPTNIGVFVNTSVYGANDTSADEESFPILMRSFIQCLKENASTPAKCEHIVPSCDDSIMQCVNKMKAYYFPFPPEEGMFQQCLSLRNVNLGASNYVYYMDVSKGKSTFGVVPYDPYIAKIDTQNKNEERVINVLESKNGLKYSYLVSGIYPSEGEIANWLGFLKVENTGKYCHVWRLAEKDNYTIFGKPSKYFITLIQNRNYIHAIVVY